MIAEAMQRLAALTSQTASGAGPIPALRRAITAETGVGGAERALDENPYVTLRASHIEAACRAWAENPASVEPWTLLALWVKEGLSFCTVSPFIAATDADDARALYRSRRYFQNLGADHYVRVTANTSGDSSANFAPGTGAAHDAAFRASIAAQLAAGRLARDIGPEIDAQLLVVPTWPGRRFTVTEGPRFQALSLMLVDAFFRENRTGATRDLRDHRMTTAARDRDAMTYMRWNMGPVRYNQMLSRNMAGNRDADGTAPSLPNWALHREVRSGEWDQPRTNAIRFQYYQQAYRYLFEGGAERLHSDAPASPQSSAVGSYVRPQR